MSITIRSPLHTLLLVDAATCLAMGLLLLAAAVPLATLTAVPAALLLYAGIILLPVAAFMAIIGWWQLNSGPAVWLIIIGNALWALVSLLLLVGPWIAPNILGLGFIGVQALVVMVLTVLEYRAWAHNSTADVA
jgi:hypothetical protein